MFRRNKYSPKYIPWNTSPLDALLEKKKELSGQKFGKHLVSSQSLNVYLRGKVLFRSPAEKIFIFFCLVQCLLKVFVLRILFHQHN